MSESPGAKLAALRRMLGLIGFGSAPLGNMNRVLTEFECDETLDAAWSRGIRYFDTAPLYGHGLSEARLGRALKARRGHVVSTKVGRLLDACEPGEENSGIFLDVPHVRVRFDYSYDGVMRSFAASLARLGMERVDILFVHDVDGFTHGGRPQSEARIRELVDQGGWRALSELRTAGAVRAIGAGVNEWEPCARLLELVDPDIFLLAGRYTLLEQDSIGFMDDCVRRGVGVVVGGPFNSGVLAGKPSYNYASVPADVMKRVNALSEVCRVHDVPLAAAALQFPGAHSAVVSTIPGAQIADEVESNAALVARKIPAAFWGELKAKALVDPRAPVPGSAG
jgi:D-threo-aldose 1-dehydrogenase